MTLGAGAVSKSLAALPGFPATIVWPASPKEPGNCVHPVKSPVSKSPLTAISVIAACAAPANIVSARASVVIVFLLIDKSQFKMKKWGSILLLPHKAWHAQLFLAFSKD